jgi:hypothetical protein
MSLIGLLEDFGIALLFAAGLLGVHFFVGLFQRARDLKRDTWPRWHWDMLLDKFVEEDYTLKKHFLLRFAGLVLFFFLAIELVRWLRPPPGSLWGY